MVRKRRLVLKSMGGGYDLKIEEWLTYRQQEEASHHQLEIPASEGGASQRTDV